MLKLLPIFQWAIVSAILESRGYYLDIFVRIKETTKKRYIACMHLGKIG